MIAMLPRPLIAVCVCVLSVTSGSRCLIAAPPSVDIASIVDLFDDDAPLDASQVSYTRKDSTVVASRFFTDRKMRRVGLRMTSQTYRGLKCRHDVTVYLPDRELPEESAGAAAIILGGAGIRAAAAKLDWLESIVVGLNVPCVVVEQALDAKQLVHGTPANSCRWETNAILKPGILARLASTPSRKSFPRQQPSRSTCRKFRQNGALSREAPRVAWRL